MVHLGLSINVDFRLNIEVDGYGSLKQNKTRTSKVGAISKAQKAQNNFLEKHEIFEKISFKKSHNAEKCKRGTLLDLLTYIPLQNIKNLEGEPFGDIKKFSKKVAQCRKKSKGGTL